MEVLPSALRHRVEPEDIQHALRNAVVVEETADDLLELVVMDRPQGPAVIHAMGMRAQYRRLLPKGSRR